jgi:hypothetical protein
VSPEELLARFKPQLRYDSQEAFFADSAEQMTANPGNQLRRADGEVLAQGGSLTLALLGSPTYANGARAERTDVLGVSGRDYRTQYARLRQARPELSNRVYGHAKKDSGGRLWLQYWFWYFYNDYHLAADFGLHEGDWEMVQLRMQGDEPDAALYAQHAYAEMRSWEAVEKTPDGRPVVYPGRGSHASYFEPGLYETAGWFDIADGKRDTPELELEILHDGQPPWVLWPGFWGDTKKGGVLGFLEDESPRGPSQHAHWKDPAALLERAIERSPARPAAEPEVSVTRAHGNLHLSFDFTHQRGGEPLKLVVTVNSEDEPGVPPKTFTFDVAGLQRGELNTRCALAPERHYDVNTSLIVRVDGKDMPTASVCTPLEPGLESKIPSWLKQPIWVIQRLFERR